jgi:hypothetical protein
MYIDIIIEMYYNNVLVLLNFKYEQTERLVKLDSQKDFTQEVASIYVGGHIKITSLSDLSAFRSEAMGKIKSVVVDGDMAIFIFEDYADLVYGTWVYSDVDSIEDLRVSLALYDRKDDTEFVLTSALLCQELTFIPRDNDALRELSLSLTRA